MSQKRIKRMKRGETAKAAEVPVEYFLGFREIVKQNWKFLLALGGGIFLVYINSLNGAFVSDDYASITQNPEITNFWAMIKYLSIPGIINSFLAAVFGVSSPAPYHFLNLTLYLGICVLAFVFIAILFDRIVAILTLIIFGFHPIHAEAVSWISGRPYLLTTALVLAALICGLLYLKKRDKKYILILLLSLVLMFFTDRIRGFSFFLLTVLISFCFKEKYFKQFDLGKTFLYFLVSLTVIGVFAYPMAMNRIQTVNSGYNVSESVFYDPLFQYPTAISKYLQLLVVPIDLTLYHTMYVFPVWLNWSILILYLTSLVYFFIKNRSIFFALAFIFVATAPSMLPVKVSWLAAERYVFFGSLGFCLLAAMILNNFLKRQELIVAGILGVLAAGGAFRTVARNVDWQTNHNLWVNTCQVSPNSHNAWNNIGDDYDKLGQYENSIKGFSQSTLVKPNYADAYHNRANIFFKVGRLDLARESYETALYFSPTLLQTYFSLTQIDLMERKIDLALGHAQKALQLQQNNPQAWYVLGMVLINSGDADKAKEAFKNTLVLAPNFQPAKDALATLEKK